MLDHVFYFIFLPRVFATCVNPCQDKPNCQTFIDSCHVSTTAPSENRGSFAVPKEYDFSFGTHIRNCGLSWHGIIELTAGGDCTDPALNPKENRVFGLWIVTYELYIPDG